jgi:glycogen(starch) synthase
MKILMFGWEFPPHISGGLGVACYGMTRTLKALGHDITFVIPRLKSESEPGSPVTLLDANHFASSEPQIEVNEIAKLYENVELMAVPSLLRPYLNDIEYLRFLTRLEYKSKEYRTVDGSHSLFFTGDYGPNLMDEVFRYARRAGEIAVHVEHDVIHAHDWLTMLAGIEAKRLSGRPLVVHVHALEFDRSGEAVNQQVYEIERFGMTHADRVVAVSHYTKDLIARRYGISPDKISVVYNATTHQPSDWKSSSRALKEKVVLFLGRITFQKGPDYFVEAAGRVLKERDDVRFVMAGSGDMVPRLVRRVAQLRMGRKFHFTGFLNGTAVERIYQESNVYVMPSVSEPFGISPLEAMSHHVPVIISKQSGVSEILRNALKVDFWDTRELANKIMALLDHKPLSKEIAEQGMRELENIRWETAAQRLTEIYGRLI